MTKIFLVVVSLVLFQDAFAALIEDQVLFSYAEKNSYQDNRKKLKKDKEYQVWKDCCHNGKPYYRIFGFRGVSSFKQVALSSGQCGSKMISKEQIENFKSEANGFYKEVFNQDLSPELMHNLMSDDKIHEKSIVVPETGAKVRVTTGALKCDGTGGTEIRFDIFVK